MNQGGLTILEDCIGEPDGLDLVLPLYLYPNRSGCRAPKIQGLIDEATALLVKKYGQHIPDKAMVAFHEAGHSVIGSLIDYKVLEAQVWSETGAWAGRVFTDDDAFKEHNNDWLWRECLIRIAGFACEKLVGEAHPSVTVHEKIHSLILGRCLDQTFNQKARSHFNRALEYCEAALEANLGIVNEIAFRLLNTGRVRGAEIAELMESAVLWPIGLADIGEVK